MIVCKSVADVNTHQRGIGWWFYGELYQVLVGLIFEHDPVKGFRVGEFITLKVGIVSLIVDDGAD